MPLPTIFYITYGKLYKNMQLNIERVPWIIEQTFIMRMLRKRKQKWKEEEEG